MNNSIMRLRIAAVPALETLESRTFLSVAQQPATFDPSFGNNGAIYLTTQRPEDVRTVAAVALPGGKMLLLGQLPMPTGFLLARVNPDGSMDGSFGDRGVVVVYNGGWPHVPSSSKSVLNGTIFDAHAMAVDSRGRIYIGGNDGSDAGAIARMNPDGSTDASFGDHGMLDPILDEINAIACEADGSIVVGGYVRQSAAEYATLGRHNFAIAHVRANGTLDGSFGHDGVAVAKFRERAYGSRNIARINSAVHALSIDGSGKIIAAGGEDGFLDIARFGKDGVLDPTFGSGGEAVVYGDRRRDSAILFEAAGGPFFSTVAIRGSDGEIFAAGGSPAPLGSDPRTVGPLVVAAFKSNGNLDGQFGHGGTTQMALAPDGNNFPRRAQAKGIAFLPAGGVLISGSFAGGLLLARLDSHGMPDRSFATMLPLAPGANAADALRYVPSGNAADAVGLISMARGAAGKFIVPLSGIAPGALYQQLHSLRFNADGSIDASYGRRGSSVVPFTIPDTASPMKFVASTQTPGEIYAQIQRDKEVSIVALSNRGQRVTTIKMRSTIDRLSVLGVQADGKVLVEQRQEDESVDLVRYNPDGSIDRSWGNAGHVHFQKTLKTASIAKALIESDGSIAVDVSENGSGPATALTLDTLYLLDSQGRVEASHPIPQFAIPPWFNQSVYTDMALSPDGKVVISTSTPNLVDEPTLGVLRLRQDLSVDTAFGNSGTVSFDSSPKLAVSFGMGNSIVVLPDSRILIAGLQKNSATGKLSSVLVCITSTGQVDATFGNAGILKIGEGDGITSGDLLVQQAGRFLVVVRDARNLMWVTRYNSDGSIDASFGQGGATRLPRGSARVALTQTPAGEMMLIAGTVTSTRWSYESAHRIAVQTIVRRMVL